AGVGELRDGQRAVLEAHGRLGPRAAQAGRAGVEQLLHGGAGVVLGGELVRGVQQLRQRDQLRHARRLADERPLSGDPVPQGPLAGVVADPKQEVEVVEPTRRTALGAGTGALGLLDEVPAPAVRGAVGERPHEARLVLRARDEGKRRVDARPAAGQVARVVEERGRDLAALPGDVRLPDQDRLSVPVHEDLDGGHRARLFVRLPARRRPTSLSRGSTAPTARSSTPSARSTCATLPKPTPGSPASILRSVSLVIPARSATCCAVRPSTMRQPCTCSPNAVSSRSMRYPLTVYSLRLWRLYHAHLAGMTILFVISNETQAPRGAS